MKRFLVLACMVSSVGLFAAIPSSANAFTCPLSGAVCITDGNGHELAQYSCIPNTGAYLHVPVRYIWNFCSGQRVWLHQYLNGPGWSYCINWAWDGWVPSQYTHPQGLYVSSNPAPCP